MSTSEEKTKQFWSKGIIAKLYRKFSGKHFLKMHRQVAHKILPRNPNDILDIACGGGDFLLYLSPLLPNAHLVGTDIAPGMVASASGRLDNKANIIEASVETLPFPENSFDVITIMMAFHHFSEKEKVLATLRNLLRPGGIIIIADVIAPSDFQKRFWDFLEKLTGVRGYVGHYTESDLKEIAQHLDFTFSCERIIGMPGRYKVITISFHND